MEGAPMGIGVVKNSHGEDIAVTLDLRPMRNPHAVSIVNISHPDERLSPIEIGDAGTARKAADLLRLAADKLDELGPLMDEDRS